MIKIKLLENEFVQFLVAKSSLDEIKNEEKIFLNALISHGYDATYLEDEHRFLVSVDQFESIYNIHDLFKLRSKKQNDSQFSRDPEHTKNELLTYQFEIQKRIKPIGRVEAFFDAPKQHPELESAEILISEKILMNDRIKNSRSKNV